MPVRASVNPLTAVRDDSAPGAAESRRAGSAGEITPSAARE
jgi:hypothetical protein